MYRGDFVRKRVLSFLLAALAAFCFICSSAPEAHAIVPVGLVQSALASYVASVGYKMFNDQGTGQEILGALGDLYDSFATSPTGTALNILSLTALADAQDIYLDLTGNMIVTKSAANMFQSFSDWLQTEYSIPDNTDTPTTVVSPSGGNYTSSTGFVAHSYAMGQEIQINTTFTYIGPQIGTTYNGEPLYLGINDIPGSVVMSYYRSGSTYELYIAGATSNKVQPVVWRNSGGYVKPVYVNNPPSYYYPGFLKLNGAGVSYNVYPEYSTSVPLGDLTFSDLSYSPGLSGLALSIAQSVVDRANDLSDDESLVVAVGAGVGATAEDVTAIVAQGVKAQTLDPSVTVVADAVIDTPVQPYPDIDSLGLPQLGAALVNRFPFCIPWDFVDTVRLLSAEPQPINISVDLIPQRIKTAVGVTSDTSFHIDLSGEQYARIGVFCRWGSLITFCFGLFLLTKRLVWTA